METIKEVVYNSEQEVMHNPVDKVVDLYSTHDDEHLTHKKKIACAAELNSLLVRQNQLIDEINAHIKKYPAKHWYLEVDRPFMILSYSIDLLFRG